MGWSCRLSEAERHLTVAKEAGPRTAYARAGVDVEAGERAVALMRAAVEATHGPAVIGGLGGFGGAIAIPAGYREPVLVSSTDGVGTKAAIAAALGRYDTIGRDLVAMCADAVVCSGAAPLFFLAFLGFERTARREQPLAKHDHEHDIEFEAFGLMNR